MKLRTTITLISAASAGIYFFSKGRKFSSTGSTNVFSNANDFVSDLKSLKNNIKVVPEVVTGIKNDVSNYIEEISPIVDDINLTIEDLKENLPS
ncbi:hypothetical protein [Companilactobacillus metriopterae]|uniref:hypothetical protein n=1 Tax=Companilactobacillus metriopterae TaxID=1909267 RepID=UPI00100AFFE7|nr:hypothetical protein [Companilactobacillus metriopterae]